MIRDHWFLVSCLWSLVGTEVPLEGGIACNWSTVGRASVPAYIGVTYIFSVGAESPLEGGIQVVTSYTVMIIVVVILSFKIV